MGHKLWSHWSQYSVVTEQSRSANINKNMIIKLQFHGSRPVHIIPVTGLSRLQEQILCWVYIFILLPMRMKHLNNEYRDLGNLTLRGFCEYQVILYNYDFLNLCPVWWSEIVRCWDCPDHAYWPFVSSVFIPHRVQIAPWQTSCLCYCFIFFDKEAFGSSCFGFVCSSLTLQCEAPVMIYKSGCRIFQFPVVK